MEVPDEKVNKLINVLHRLRIERGLTLDEVADLCQLHRTSIGLIERHERVPTIDTLFRIADAIQIPLSTVIQLAEEHAPANATPTPALVPSVLSTKARERFLQPDYFRNEPAFRALTGLTNEQLRIAIASTYNTLDFIDRQLAAADSPVLSGLVELANLSSMIGNVLGSAIAKSSDGLYARNKPHSYPDLIPVQSPAVPLELKVALETNRPKGHLPKEGPHLTFRYVLGDGAGAYISGKENRGSTVWIWEVKAGNLSRGDYDLSNTEGDSGKTAVVKTSVFNEKMRLIYFVPQILPYRRGKSIPYTGFN